MRSSIARRLATLALIPVALFGVVVMASPAQAAVPSTIQMQTDIVYLTNQQRVKAGCPKLRLDGDIARAARNHSAWMARTGTFSHVGSGNTSFVTRVEATGYAAPLSENIAWGFRTGAEVVNAFMKSAGHRANILNCDYHSLGVGVYYASTGGPWWTQDFGF